MKPIEKSKFYKGRPHPYDHELLSFTAINIVEVTEGEIPKFYCEFVALVPNPKQDEESLSYKWNLFIGEATLRDVVSQEDAFNRGEEHVEERLKIALRASEDAGIKRLAYERPLMVEISKQVIPGTSMDGPSIEQQVSTIIRTWPREESTLNLLDEMIEKSKSESFRRLIASLKKS